MYFFIFTARSEVSDPTTPKPWGRTEQRNPFRTLRWHVIMYTRIKGITYSSIFRFLTFLLSYWQDMVRISNNIVTILLQVKSARRIMPVQGAVRNNTVLYFMEMCLHLSLHISIFRQVPKEEVRYSGVFPCFFSRLPALEWDRNKLM